MGLYWGKFLFKETQVETKIAKIFKLNELPWDLKYLRKRMRRKCLKMFNISTLSWKLGIQGKYNFFELISLMLNLWKLRGFSLSFQILN